MSASSLAHEGEISTSPQGKQGWSTKKLVVMALFIALATIVSFVEIPIFPAAPWLKYDPSACIAMLAGFGFGPVAGVIVGVFAAVIHGLVLGDPWGSLMTIIFTVFWVLPAALIFKKKRSRGWVVVGLVISAVLALAAAIGGNLLITPIYAGVTVDVVVAMIIPVLLPFNGLKILINSVLLFFLYQPILKLMER